MLAKSNTWLKIKACTHEKKYNACGGEKGIRSISYM